MIVNTDTGEVLDLTPLRRSPRKSPYKRPKTFTRQDIWFIKHIVSAVVLVVILMGLLGSQ